MARKDKHRKTSHAAHIKQHTVGTSNELSFSVLDAAKNAADSSKGADGKAKAPRFGGISLFTLPGHRKTRRSGATDETIALPGSVNAASAQAASSSKPLGSDPVRKRYEAPVDEIARRKSRRRVRKGFALAVVVVIAVILVGGGASFFLKERAAQSERLTFIDAAIADLSAADTTLLEMDDVINSDMSVESITKATEIEKNLPSTLALLDTAEEAIMQADGGMTSASDKETIARAIAAVSTRRDMAEQGSKLMSAAVTAKQAADVVTSAWENVLGGDKTAREAAAMIVDTTEQNVIHSRDLSIQAKQLFEQALSDIQTVEGAFAELDLTAQTGYVEKRIEAMDFAIASDDAILAYNKEGASAANDAYNAADAEATVLAENLPEDPANPVYESHDHETITTNKLYNEARSKAATADAFLRDYLGANGK